MSERGANRQAVAAARRLALRKRRGFLDAVPGACTLLLLIDPREFDRERLARDLEEASGESGREGSSRLVRIPVCYGGEAAVDLADLARSIGISPEEFVRRHAAARYTVAFLGFAPGFAYLTGLPRELHAPRLATPRTRVPAGSVAIGGPYTGIYPSQTPGGWRLIGRSPVRLFDVQRNPPALLRPGDRVAFEPIGESELEEGIRSLNGSPGAPIGSGLPVFRVSKAGLWTSVQGGPRYGWVSSGVPPGGAMDPEALAFGNALLKNPAGAAALEITFVGPELEVLADVTLQLSGPETAAELNGKPIALAMVFKVRAGDRLGIGPVRGGARSYLCVAGGLARGSGPHPSRRLAAGDVVTASGEAVTQGHGESRKSLRVSASPHPRVGDSNRGGTGEILVRVVLGPQERHFQEEGIATLLSTPYRVSPSSDRRGVRLEGESIAHKRGADIPPEGTPLGAIQVPPDGSPIILGPDRPVTGGYAKIATVIGADFRLVAQAVTGAFLRFRAVTLQEALAASAGLPLLG